MASSLALSSAERPLSLWSALKRLYRRLGKRRRLHLGFVILLMLVGAAAELLTLGAVLPFLSLLADPTRIEKFAALANVAGLLGWTGDDLRLPATVLFVGMVLLASAARLLLVWVSTRFVYGVGYDLGVQVYTNTLSQPYEWHARQNSSQILAGIQKVQMVISGALLPLMLAFVGSFIALAILAAIVAIEPWAALIAGGGFALAYLGVSIAVRKMLAANSTIIANTQGTRIQAVQEGLGGIRDVILDSAHSAYIERFRREDWRLRRAQANNQIVSRAPRRVLEGLAVSAVALIGLQLIVDDGLTGALPTLGALALGGQKLIPLLQQVYAGWSKCMGNRGVFADVLALLELPDSECRTSSGPVPFEKDIVLEGVSFRYDADGEDVLQRIDLTISKGRRIGFIGATGSGKSTLLDLVMGLLKPSDGAILIDGETLGDKELRGWQQRIAHVPQAIFLSDATVSENIAFGTASKHIDPEAVRDAARLAQLDAFIQSLPEGYDTRVGERGVRLSGGQRQRIGIARALYKKADVLVLDEATSALDDETERAVMACVDGLSRELTVLTVAHRTSTLRGCDLVIELHAGQVRRRGSYADMIGQFSAQPVSQVTG